jgi:hypothetical protein
MNVEFIWIRGDQMIGAGSVFSCDIHLGGGSVISPVDRVLLAA